MAVIGKIRRYSGLAVFFIAFAIVAFILADLIGPGGRLWGGRAQNVGVISDEAISYEEYNREVETMRQNYTLQSGGKSPDENMMLSLRENAWNLMLFKKAYTKEFDKLGIAVSDKEKEMMVQGDSIFLHPEIKRQFVNPQTQKFDKAMLINYLKNIDQMPEQKVQWLSYEDYIYKDRLRTKYENLMKFSGYVTKAEAERDYQNQNTKAEVKYLQVAYTSIPDSTLASKVKEQDLKDYLNKNKNKYKPVETRSLDYVVFEVKPSKKDSAEFLQEIKELAKSFARSTNDSTFVLSNSDNPNPFDFKTPNQIPAVLFDKNPTLLKGGLYGPYLDGKIYKIFKVSDIKEDSLFYVRASHILFKADERTSAEEKQKAREKANEILQKIKEGASFEEMAKQFGSDGTAQQGGDLGWFGKGQMVAEFERAAFESTEAGLKPGIIETKFGFHILKVTYPKTNQKYKLAIVDKVLDPSDASRDEVFRSAQELLSKSPDGDQLRENVKKNPSLVVLKAEKLPTNATSLGNIFNAREAIRWAFTDGKKNVVSQVFDLQDQNKYIIATVTGMTSEKELNIENYREEIKAEVIKDMKKEQILKKLSVKEKTLEDMAKKYGAAALVSTAADLSMNSFSFGTTGMQNAIAIGRSFGLKQGKKSSVFADDSGVFVLELTKLTPAAKIADYTQYKTQLLQSLQQKVYLINEAIKDASKIKDERYKYY